MSKVTVATRSVVIEREMPHPPEKIWRALTEGPLTRPLTRLCRHAGRLLSS